ncbi:MAG: DUF5312 domain-containing protein [Spirochaetaceae bacterium]|jgi:hypothetical protein|nr:DUF5312 domain-containing protein [Spirochaetaceae bacterium]
MAEDLLGKVFSFISGDNEPDSDKKILLRQVLKEIGQNKYSKFYKPKSEEYEPAFAQFFYDLYKTIYPAQVFLQNTEKITLLRHITIEAFMDKTAKESVRRLNLNAIEERARITAPKDLIAQLKEDLFTLTDTFDANRINTANRCYNLILAFIQFVGFDFFMLLRKFDLSLRSGNFDVPPKFTAVKADSLVQDLENFQMVSRALEPVADWKNVFIIFKACQMPLIPPEQWSILLQNLRDVKSSGIIDLTVQYSIKNPIWIVKPKIPNEQAVNSWLEIKRNEVQDYINKIVNTQRNDQIEALAKGIFGTSDITRLQYYTDKNGEIYRKKNLETFTHALGLNYLLAFIVDYLEKEVQELCDILLVRGQWTNNTSSREMSDSFHQVMELTEEILALDETLSDKGDNGSRLKGALLRVDRDKTQVRYINSIIGNINEEAQDLITSAAQSLIVVGKHLKNLAEDFQKSPHELIMNWKELGYASRTPIGQRITEVYKRTNYFVQLMQFFSSSS